MDLTLLSLILRRVEMVLQFSNCDKICEQVKKRRDQNASVHIKARFDVMSILEVRYWKFKLPTLSATHWCVRIMQQLIIYCLAQTTLLKIIECFVDNLPDVSIRIYFTNLIQLILYSCIINWIQTNLIQIINYICFIYSFPVVPLPGF